MEQMQARNHPSTQHPISTTLPYSTYNQPQFPTSQSESNLAKTSSMPPKISNRKAPNWNEKEDEALCEAWVQRSKNPIVGTGQTGDTLWFHIFEDFCKKQSGTKRTKKGLENRWTAIHVDVTKWRAIVRRVNTNHQSGTNMVDELGACYEVFKNDHGRNFKFYHCWQILQDSAKWHISPGEKSKSRPSPRSDPVNATTPSASPMNDFTDIGLGGTSPDGFPDTCVYPSTHSHVSDDSPSPAIPIGPAPSCIRSEPLARPLGRKSAKEKHRRSDNNASDEASMPNKRLSDQVLEWRISQNSQFQIMQEANKAQFESLKAANEVHAFHLVRKTKLEALQSSIAIVQAIGEAEEKMINRAPHLLTYEVTDAQIARFKKLRDLERQHDEIRQLEYSPGGSASRRLNNDRSNMNPCNLKNRFNSSFN